LGGNIIKQFYTESACFKLKMSVIIHVIEKTFSKGGELLIEGKLVLRILAIFDLMECSCPIFQVLYAFDFLGFEGLLLKLPSTIIIWQYTIQFLFFFLMEKQ